MKKTTLLIVVVITGILAFNPQNTAADINKEHIKKAPDKVTAAIHKEFPQAQQVVWQRAGKRFIARFNSESGAITATFNRRGHLISTLINYSADRIPFGIRNTLDKKYPGFVPESAAEYINEGSRCYYVLLKKQTGNLVKWMRIKLDDHGNTTLLDELQQTV